MSYLKELQDHYKAVKARLRANAIPEKKLLPKPMPELPKQEEPPKPPKAGLAPRDAEGKIVNEALRQSNPDWIGGNYTQAIKIAQEMMEAPRLPPIPGLVLNEMGAVRWLRVLHAVAAYHKIDPSEILGTCRKRHVIQARFEVFYRLRVELNFSYTKIGNLMKKDHSTVLHGVSKVRGMLLDRLREQRNDDGLADEHPSARNTHTNQSAGLSP